MATYRQLQQVLKSARNRNDYVRQNIITSKLNSKKDELERMAFVTASYYGLEFNEFIQQEIEFIGTNTQSTVNSSNQEDGVENMTYRNLQLALKQYRSQGFYLDYPLNSKRSVLVGMYQSCMAQAAASSNLANRIERVDYEQYSYERRTYTYHYGNGVKLNQRKVGVEIEFCTRLTKQEVIEIIKQETGITLKTGGRFSQRDWKIKTDGSISQGWEIVSPPMVDFNELKDIMYTLETCGYCHVDYSCGLHTHIEAKDMTREQMVRYFLVWQQLETVFDRLVTAGRRNNNNHFCQSIVDYYFNQQDTLASICSKMDNRYHKLNPFSFLKYGTFEVRHLEGTLDYDKLENWINLQREVLEYSLDHTVEQTVNHIKQRLYAQV